MPDGMQQIQFPPKMQCLFLPKRTKVFYGGRGSGKSWSVARALVLKARYDLEPAQLGQEPKWKEHRILCAREVQNSIAQSVHKLLSNQISDMGLSADFEIQRDRIICKVTNSQFFFEGIKANVDRIKSYEGVSICWVEEAHNVSKDSWDTLIPTIRAPGSEIWLTFNPNLKTDETYKRFVLTPDPDTCVVNVNWRDNPWFGKELMAEMLKLKRTDFQAYLNVWEGQCRVLLDGAVYAKELKKFMAGNRLTDVPYDPSIPVDCIWDLGWADKTAIWFRQKVGFEFRYIRYLEVSQTALKDIIFQLQQLGYNYGAMFLPHDARAKELGSGMSIEEQVRKFFRVIIVKRHRINDGIDAVRSHLQLAWIDKTNCSLGFDRLAAYRYEVVDTEGNLSKEPVHDDASHAADGFRYSAVSANMSSRADQAEINDAIALQLDPTLGYDTRLPSLHSNDSSGKGWMA